MSTTGSLFILTNQNLFSTNYLENRLPQTGLWRDQASEAARAFSAIVAAYEEVRKFRLGPGEEANLEDRFIRPVFKALGFAYDVQPITQRGTRKKRPDYALFASEADLKSAREEKTNLSRFFSHSLTVAEAKYWNRPLNDTVSEDTLDSRDATAQLVKYLDDVHYHSDGRILWGILTNGKLWRLFYYRAISRSGNYYEVDLEEVIQRKDTRAFLYFYLFFARDAFVVDPQTGKTWLDQHREGSETYAKEVGEKLKERIFDHVFERLAEGFLEYRKHERRITSESDASLKEVFNGCLTLLYRLLFILYAEARELLPVRETHGYYTKSFQKLKEDVISDLRRGVTLSRRSYDYWSRLDTLRRVVDEGDKDLNIPKYNGGLFQHSAPTEDQSSEAKAIRFIRDHKLADPYLAEAIEALTVDDTASDQPGQSPLIDYSSLNVRHLGDIYEGLLEFHVRVATEEMVEVKEKSRSVWKSLREVKEGTWMHRRRKPGEVYIENSRHERRATGSYFTPHYIVEYVVKHTVGPVLEERLTTVKGLLEEYEKLREKSRKQRTSGAAQVVRTELLEKEKEIFDTLFSLKVLDPAMGSGHFLVHTVDFIADRIITFLAEYPENPVVRRVEKMKKQILEDVRDRQGVEIDETRLTEVNLIKRMVMKRSIYGVDLNPMAVELAKLSLWLDSFTLGAPLSFLDHHLKCGNSLIGTAVEEVKKGMGEEEFEGTQTLLFGSRFAGLLSATELMRAVGELTDSTFDEVQRSTSLYREADEALVPFKMPLDFWVSEHFGAKGARNFLKVGGDVTSLLRAPEKLSPQSQELLSKVKYLKAEKRFFHWELEFPEVFYNQGGTKDQPGFDAVIGNPPYVRIQKQEDIEEKEWLKTYRTVYKNYDLYIPFTEQGFSLTSRSGRFCFIIPNKFFQTEYGEKLRELVTQGHHISQIVNFGDNQIFADSRATTYTCLFFLSWASLNEFLYYEVLPLGNVSEELPEIMTELDRSPLNVKMERFEAKNFSRSPWVFGIGPEQQILEKASQCSNKLGYIASQIIVGLQTSADHIYILEKREKGTRPRFQCVYSFSQDRELEIEASLLKPLISGEDIERYGTPDPHYVLLFPYKLQTGGGAKLIPADEFDKRYPLTWNYLKDHERELRNREGGKFDDDE